MKQLILAISGLIFGIILIVLGFVQKHKQSDYTETTAEITEITVEAGTGDDSDTHHVYVKYTVDGKEYNEELDEYSSKYKVGKSVKIKYNPDNPADITSSGNIPMIICFVSGILLTLGSGIFLGAGAYYVFKKQ